MLSCPILCLLDDSKCPITNLCRARRGAGWHGVAPVTRTELKRATSEAWGCGLRCGAVRRGAAGVAALDGWMNWVWADTDILCTE